VIGSFEETCAVSLSLAVTAPMLLTKARHHEPSQQHPAVPDNLFSVMGMAQRLGASTARSTGQDGPPDPLAARTGSEFGNTA
jgi:hypothetical protein